MKKLIYFVAIIITALSCKSEPNDFVTLSGKISNKNSDSIIISGAKNYKKTIKLNKDGSFSDTLNVKTELYFLSSNGAYVQIYLRNGMDLNITLDAKNIYETISFTKSLNHENIHLSKSTLKFRTFLKNADKLLALPQEDYDSKMRSFTDNIIKELDTITTDTIFISLQKKRLEEVKNQIEKVRQNRIAINKKLAKGLVSPVFENYENFKGGTTSLSDLKGKYVYIDLWATWCIPCKKEIPFLKEVEKKFHDKNIEFVSISIDKSKDHDAWKKMVSDESLTGMQLFADNDWKSKFIKDYMVATIPRFILIDTKGNIIDSNAPRPSDPKLIELFNSLNI
ncbi:TlpA family protein disulfide reductase [Tenacibaculum sp. MEBiC06402]|uniref:TlpA family protein disulfide reductase n=1 Tax=unclassified Tenacibaculum TaxID=2635139 RepID=UPI003B9AA704